MQLFRTTFLFVIVSLFISSCSDEDDTTMVDQPEEEETLVTYTDIEFGIPGSTTLGRFFSTASGKMYLSSEVTEANGPTIDLVYDNLTQSVNFFGSPDDESYEIAGGTATRVTNFVTDEFMVEDFDSMKDDSLIKDLTIEDDGESFPSDYKGVVLFQNASGKKGVIKVKALNSERVLVDIKVQK